MSLFGKMKGAFRRQFSFGVLLFDDADNICGTDYLFTFDYSRERALERLREGIPFSWWSKECVKECVVVQIFSGRDVCCAEIRRPVTLEAHRKWNDQPEFN